MIFRSRSFLFLVSLVSLLGCLNPVLASSPQIALQAQQMLGQERWAVAVQIENTNKKSRYPETVYATIFEFENSLWFYTSSGTQPLVASKHRMNEFKENLLPLLRTVDRGFVSFERLNPLDDRLTTFPQLPNGCVIESIYTMGGLKKTGTPVLAAKLLLYSSTKNTRRGTNGNATGHCVLIFQTPDGMFFVDPPELGVTGSIRKVQDWDPVQMASEIESAYGNISIEEAFFVPFQLPVLAQSS